MTALALDRLATIHTATRWDGELIRARLVEAFEIEARIPDGKGPRRSSASAWPTMAREFGDIVGWATEAREDWWIQAARAKGVHAYEATRMYEALDWLTLLKDRPEEQKMLHAWAATRALRRSLKKVCKIKGWDKQTFYRRRNDGSARIADELNRKAVAVR